MTYAEAARDVLKTLQEDAANVALVGSRDTADVSAKIIASQNSVLEQLNTAIILSRYDKEQLPTDNDKGAALLE